MRNKKGFTLVELVIVIAVIAILAGVMIAVFANVVKDAQESAELQEMKNQELAQKADDILKKVDNADWMGWTDFEEKLAAVIAENTQPAGASKAEVTAALKEAMDEYLKKAAENNTSLTEAQVKVIVENALAGHYSGVTEAQVKAIINSAVAGTSTLTRAQVQSIVDTAQSKNMTAVQVAAYVAEIKAAIGTVPTDEDIKALILANTLKEADVQAILEATLPVTKKVTPADASKLSEIAKSLNSGSTIMFTGTWTTANVTFEENKTLNFRGSTVETLTINAPAATINVYNKVTNLNVEAVATSSLHVYEEIKNAIINGGRVVFETGAKVENIKVEPVAKDITGTALAVNTASVKLDITPNVVIPVLTVVPTGTAVEVKNEGTVQAVQVAIAQEKDVKTSETTTETKTVAIKNPAVVTITTSSTAKTEIPVQIVEKKDEAPVVITEENKAEIVAEIVVVKETSETGVVTVETDTTIKEEIINKVVEDTKPVETNSDTVRTISSVTSLNAFIAEGGFAKLGANITLDTTVTIPASSNIVLDTNGYSITSTVTTTNKNACFYVEGKFTVKGDGTFNGVKFFQVNGTNAVVTIDGGTYNGRLASVSGSKATTNLYTADTADKYDIGGTLIFNNGKVNGGDDAGVFIGYKAVVTINGGTVSSVKYPLSSNGTNEGKDYGEGILTINNGIVECSDSTAIYIPSNMTVAINGGKITGVSGIEFKAGAATVDLSVNGGFVKATGTNTTPNQTVDNGTSGWGEAITIIYSAAYGDSTDVTLAGGVFTSAVGKKAVGTYYYSETEITSQGEKVLSPVTGNTNFPKYVYEWVNNVPLNITGGTYSSAPADQLIESGYEYNSTTGIVAAK